MSLAIPSLGLGMLSGRSLQARAIAALTAAAGAEPWFLYDHRGAPYQWQSIAGTTPAVAGQPVGKVDPVAGTLSVAAALDNSTRPTLSASPAGATLDAFDDLWAAASGGGGTAGFFYCCGYVPAGDGATRTVISDRQGGVSGIQLNIASGNALQLATGDGATNTATATANGSLTTAGGTKVLTAWYDGSRHVQIGLDTPVDSTAVTVAAGSAAFTIGRRNDTATTFLAGTLVCEIYIRNVSPNAATRLLAQQLMAQWAGVSL